MSVFILGLDFGQMQDYTAISIVERIGKNKKDAIYHLRHLERFQLGTSYPDVVSRVKELMSNEPLINNTYLIVDATGVGVAVIDILHYARLNPVPVTITNGETVTRNGQYWRVPKRELVSQLQVLLQTQKFKMAESLPEASILVQELLSFRVKITDRANDIYGPWREGIHDDMVLAVALAVWWGQRTLTPRPVVRAYIV